MANPTDVPCPAGVWTLVATAIQTGELEILDGTVEYLYTHRDTGGGPPTTLVEGTGLSGHKRAHIRDSEPIDVYIWAIGSAGNVRLHS